MKVPRIIQRGNLKYSQRKICLLTSLFPLWVKQLGRNGNVWQGLNQLVLCQKAVNEKINEITDVPTIIKIESERFHKPNGKMKQN